MWIKTQYLTIESITNINTGTVYQLFPATSADFPQHIAVNGDRVIANGDSATRAWVRLSKLVLPGNDFTTTEPAAPTAPLPALSAWAVGDTVWFSDLDGYTPVDGGEIVAIGDDDPRGKRYHVQYTDIDGDTQWADFYAHELRDVYVPF